MILEDAPALPPLHFFSLAVDLPRGKSVLLPDTSEYLGEESFAAIRMKWEESGLAFDILFHKPFEGAFYPEYSRGEAVELLIDTRDLKTAGFPTKFCHRFLILPQAVGEMRAQEITRFRAEESHVLCDKSLIAVDSEFAKKSFRVKIELPAEALHGFDPKTFDRLGFTYRIFRTGGAAQHFALTSRFCAIEQQNALWATLVLRP